MRRPPLTLALSSVLTATIDVAARPALLAVLGRPERAPVIPSADGVVVPLRQRAAVPAQRRAVDDLADDRVPDPAA